MGQKLGWGTLEPVEVCYQANAARCIASNTIQKHFHGQLVK